MKKFNAVINEMRRTAMIHPLNRNADPKYFNEDGKPCCIVGRALNNLGLSTHLSCSAFQLPWNDWGFECPNQYQSLWITKVQASTDSGDAWIIAIATADATTV